MDKIYEQHKTSFAAVSAFVVVKDGVRVATVALKFHRSTTAYVHIIGLRMVRSTAGGGGYDRASAAVESCIRKIQADEADDRANAVLADFARAVPKMDSQGWLREIERAGYSVFQAV